MLNFGGRLTATTSVRSFARTTLRKHTFESAGRTLQSGLADLQTGYECLWQAPSSNEKQTGMVAEAQALPAAAGTATTNRGDWTAEALEERRWVRALVRSFDKPGTNS